MSKVYGIITEKLLSIMENSGELPWKRPWNNAARSFSGHVYRGSNAFFLNWFASAAGWENPVFLTYNKIKELGGKVNEGEKPSLVTFWSFFNKKNASGDETDEQIAIFRYYQTYCIDQISGIAPPTKTVKENLDAQAIVDGFKNKPTIKTAGDRAFYSPDADTITIPPIHTFSSSDEYYCTLFHELAHSTGARTRLNREGITNPIQFASHEYSVEELIAELTASFLCAECGITNTLNNSAAYLKGWLQKLKSDPKMFVMAAQRAQKAADLILGKSYKEAQE